MPASEFTTDDLFIIQSPQAYPGKFELTLGHGIF